MYFKYEEYGIPNSKEGKQQQLTVRWSGGRYVWSPDLDVSLPGAACEHVVDAQERERRVAAHAAHSSGRPRVGAGVHLVADLHRSARV